MSQEANDQDEHLDINKIQRQSPALSERSLFDDDDQNYLIRARSQHQEIYFADPDIVASSSHGPSRRQPVTVERSRSGFYNLPGRNSLYDATVPPSPNYSQNNDDDDDDKNGKLCILMKRLATLIGIVGLLAVLLVALYYFVDSFKHKGGEIKRYTFILYIYSSPFVAFCT